MAYTGFIYIITNEINGKSYIGQTCAKNPNQRWCNGRGYSRRNPAFYNAIQKYGWDNFEHEILVDNIPTLEEANKLEIEFIAKYHTYIRDPECNGYNNTIGGQGRAHEQSEETKQKISATLKNRVFTPEHLAKIQANLPKKSIICIETNIIYESIAEAHNQTGISYDNIKTAVRGKRNSAGGYHWANSNDTEQIEYLKTLAGKCKASKRKIRCVETNQTYESISEAARILGVNASGIGVAIKGKTRVKGYHWEYLD